MSLRRKLLLSLLATLFPLAALGIAAYALVNDSLLESAQNEVELLAGLRAAELARAIDVAMGELESISLWPEIAGPATSGAAESNPELLDDPLSTVLTWWAEFREVAVVARDGTSIRATDPAYGERLVLPSLVGPGVGLPQLVDGRWLVSVSRPIGPSRDVFVMAEIASDYLVVGGLLPADAPDLSQPGAVIVRGDRGTFVAFVADHQSVEAAVATATAVAERGVDLTGIRPVAGVDLSVAVQADRGSVLEPLERLRWIIAISLGLALVVAVMLASVLGRTVSRRIGRLRDATTAISQGDWSRRAGDRGSDELGELSDSFDMMAEQLASDNTRRRQIEDELSHQALHDPLTGLANRVKFLDRLEDALARSTRSGSPVAVLFCDLDNLKVVNDRLGHTAGDDLLTGVAERFRHSVRPSDTVARFGGDEFVILCAEMASSDDAIVVADRLCAALVAPFYLAGEPVASTASIGIAVGTGASANAVDLVRDADSAMYEAKQKGRAQYVLHSETLSDRSVRRELMAAEAATALSDNELRLEYQPVVELETGRLVHVEAFVRWDHPDRGVVGPNELLAQFDDAKLLVDLDQWVLDAALEQLAIWNVELHAGTPLPLTVNLSAVTVRSETLPELIRAAMERHGIDAGQLSVEVAEPALVADPSAALNALDHVRELGVDLILDDFGTGHISVERLRRFRFCYMKVHGSLVNGLDRHDEGPLVAAISLAGALKMNAVAEGVERIEQVPMLLDHGIRFAQGHLFCAPVGPDGLRPWLDRLEL